MTPGRYETEKARKAEVLAYRKPLVAELNIEYIYDQLYSIQEECENVRYFVESDDDTLISALEGDEEQAYEFKMMFCSLDSDCERLTRDLDEEYVPECFNDWFCTMQAGQSFGGYMGYDKYEEDYVSLRYESFVEQDSGKRIMRMSKQDIVNSGRQCFRVFTSYMSLKSRYDDLKCAFDVLREKNQRFLQIIKDIEKAYERCVEESDSKAEYEFEKLTAALPDETWIQ